MNAAVYIGDEPSAAGYRLAGLDTTVCTQGGESEAFEQALKTATIVLVSSAVAARIQPARLHDALIALTPLVAIVPVLDGSVPLPDVGARARADIGLSP